MMKMAATMLMKTTAIILMKTTAAINCSHNFVALPSRWRSGQAAPTHCCRYNHNHDSNCNFNGFYSSLAQLAGMPALHKAESEGGLKHTFVFKSQL